MVTISDIASLFMLASLPRISLPPLYISLLPTY